MNGSIVVVITSQFREVHACANNVSITLGGTDYPDQETFLGPF